MQQHLVCGTEHARQQALAAGCAPSRVHRSSGMIPRPEFYFAPPIDRMAERQRLGLDVDMPTTVVLFGGTGSRVMKRIAQALPKRPLILLCGRNAALAEELRALPSSAPRVVVGYTPDVARWMQLGDYFIGKPGPGSLSEAVQMSLPVIVKPNASTRPQERWNTDWVQANGLGVVKRSFSDVAQALDDVVCALPAFQARVRRMDNQAVFEIPHILNGILQAQSVQPGVRSASPG